MLAFAARLREGAKVSLLFGAGVSVACGIPDFRSQGGMYATLRPELLTATPEQRARMAEDPTEVVNRSLFLQNPLPYHELRRPFILGTAERRWRPTVAHAFAKALADAGQLSHLYTQNIDSLERSLDFPEGSVIAVHGTIAEAGCEACGKAAEAGPYLEAVRQSIRDIYEPEKGPQMSTPIACAACGKAAVKPTTVLFGGALPEGFFSAAQEDFSQGRSQALIVAGTSLRVFPAASLLPAAGGCGARLVINREEVGAELGFGELAGDCFLQADADAGFLRLAQQVGLLPRLLKYAPQLCDASRKALEEAAAEAEAPH